MAKAKINTKYDQPTQKIDISSPEVRSKEAGVEQDCANISYLKGGLNTTDMGLEGMYSQSSYGPVGLSVDEGWEASMNRRTALRRHTIEQGLSTFVKQDGIFQ